MSAHLSNEIVERFHAQSLTGSDRSVIYDHIPDCETCRRRVVTSQAETVALRGLTDHLLPKEGEEPYHLDPATVEAFVNDTLDPLDRSTTKLHLEDCEECSAEVTDLRESLATMKAASRQQVDRPLTAEVAKSRSLRLSMPIRIAATVALVAFAAVALIAVLKWRSNSPSITTGSQPTPLGSPQVPALTPSPDTGANPPKLAENPPTKELGEQPRNVIALKDGSNEIALDQSGNVVGLFSLPAETREAVKEALTEERLSRPSVLDDVTSAEVSVRGPGSEERISISSPANTVINNNKPTLRWTPSTIAEAYRVEIADETFHQVAKSADLPATTRSWTPSIPLKRGGIYTWTIRAVNQGGEPSAVTSQAKFRILGEDKVRQLNRLKTGPQSHLALGIFYAREGMLAEAEREIGILVKENPNSGVVKKLLKQIGSWRKL
jgi:hypothetical protein